MKKLKNDETSKQTKIYLQNLSFPDQHFIFTQCLPAEENLTDMSNCIVVNLAVEYQGDC